MAEAPRKTMVEIVMEDGHVSDSPRDLAIRQLAEWEDRANAGQLNLDPDDLAMIRHVIQYPQD